MGAYLLVRLSVGQKVSMLPPPSLYSLPRADTRLSFLYVEHCVVHRTDGALTIRDRQGTVSVPSSQLLVLLVGPGTSISHQAMVVLGQTGATIAWVGEGTVRMYAAGRTLSQSSRLVEHQSRLVVNQEKRLETARRMYRLRFPNEDVSSCSMRQLRGREGTRMKRAYRQCAHHYGVEWQGRIYDRDDFESGDPINQALSLANSVLYAVVHAVIHALGASTALGFVHTGHQLSFVYDIADLYKTQSSIPVAFSVVGESYADLFQSVRIGMRKKIFETCLIQRCVQDIQHVLQIEENDDEYLDSNVVMLWDYSRGRLAAGQNYGGDTEQGGNSHIGEVGGIGCEYPPF